MFLASSIILVSSNRSSSTKIITIVEVSIAYAKHCKNRDLYPSYDDWLGPHKTERERETETERGGVQNKSE